MPNTNLTGETKRRLAKSLGSQAAADDVLDALETIVAATVSATSVTATTFTGRLRMTANGPVAAAGSSEADAAAVLEGITLVTGADDAKGVKLPAAIAAGGQIVILKVGPGADLKIYPNTGDAINKGTVTTGALTVVDDVSVLLYSVDGTDWYSLPLLPS